MEVPDYIEQAFARSTDRHVTGPGIDTNDPYVTYVTLSPSDEELVLSFLIMIGCSNTYGAINDTVEIRPHERGPLLAHKTRSRVRISPEQIRTYCRNI